MIALLDPCLSNPSGRMHSEDLRALTPLIYSHVTPYETFRLDMNERLVIETAVAA
jgi:hypothetical protein